MSQNCTNSKASSFDKLVSSCQNELLELSHLFPRISTRTSQPGTTDISGMELRGGKHKPTTVPNPRIRKVRFPRRTVSLDYVPELSFGSIETSGDLDFGLPCSQVVGSHMANVYHEDRILRSDPNRPASLAEEFQHEAVPHFRSVDVESDSLDELRERLQALRAIGTHEEVPGPGEHQHARSVSDIDVESLVGEGYFLPSETQSDRTYTLMRERGLSASNTALSSVGGGSPREWFRESCEATEVAFS